MGPEIEYTGEKPDDSIELRVYRGANGNFALYEDEGDNYGYEKGRFATIPLSWDETAQKLTVGARQGRFPGMLESRKLRVEFVGGGTAKTVSYAGEATTVDAR